jgi:hypothetical protein
MPNTHSRSTLFTRRYYGEDKATPLVLWLNSPADPGAENYEQIGESKARIAQILDSLAELGTVGGTEVEKCTALVAQINKVLNEFAIVPYVWLVPGKELSCALDLMPAAGSTDYAGLALIHFVDLWRAGLISNLRRCKNCGKFLFQRFSHQEFCPGGQCREAEKSSPAYKDKRNKRVSESRAQERLRDLRNRERNRKKKVR